MHLSRDCCRLTPATEVVIKPRPRVLKPTRGTILLCFRCVTLPGYCAWDRAGHAGLRFVCLLGLPVRLITERPKRVATLTLRVQPCSSRTGAQCGYACVHPLSLALLRTSPPRSEAEASLPRPSRSGGVCVCTNETHSGAVLGALTVLQRWAPSSSSLREQSSVQPREGRGKVEADDGGAGVGADVGAGVGAGASASADVGVGSDVNASSGGGGVSVTRLVGIVASSSVRPGHIMLPDAPSSLQIPPFSLVRLRTPADAPAASLVRDAGSVVCITKCLTGAVGKQMLHTHAHPAHCFA